MNTYTYTVLRYIHDTTSGEFVNVGVALFCPNTRFLGAKCKHTYGRITKVFPGADGEAIKYLLRSIESEFANRAERVANELPIEPASTVSEHAHAIIPKDDSSLQWSSIGSGLTNDAAQTLEKLYERMVIRYEDRPTQDRRSDDEVWRTFRRDLECRQILDLFEPKRISARDDEIEFKHAWKNGVWHCVEPVSFDLSSAENIRDKAHRWLGQLTSVKDTGEKFKVYLIVGEPQQNQLETAFEKAIKILEKIPVPKEIYRESNALQLSEKLAHEVRTHLEQEERTVLHD